LIGFSITESDETLVQEHYNDGIGVWIDTNKSGLEDGTINISEFFQETPSCYKSGWVTNSIVGIDLEEITNIQELIG
jgi:hypothetical protein